MICANNDVKSILIVGVGGQGTLLASRIIGNTALKQGYDVKISEVHGMSQRGGSVVTYVRYGSGKVHSPLISTGFADVILAFEELEAYRNINYLKNDGILLVNKQRILPMPVITGVCAYPNDLLDDIQNKGIKIYTADALGIAEEAGDKRAVNVVLIGMLAALCGAVDFDKETWLNSLRDIVKPAFIDINLRAFEAGYNCVR